MCRGTASIPEVEIDRFCKCTVVLGWKNLPTTFKTFSFDRVISGDIDFSASTSAVLPLWMPLGETGSGNQQSVAVVDSTQLEQLVDVFKCRNLLNGYFPR